VITGWKTSKIVSRQNSLIAHIDPDMGYLVQREHPQNYGGIGAGAHKTCNISETLQDRTKVTMTD